MRLQSKLADYQPKTPEVKTTTGAYTLVASDLGKLVIVDGALDLPSLPAGYNVFIYNTSVSAVGFSASGGVTIDNTTNTSISAKGSISVFYLDATTVIVDGNTEV